MEDIQDGIKVSIQDGVEEDPEQEEKFVVKGKSGAMIMYLTGEVVNPQMTTIHSETTDSEQKIATMTTIVSTQVT